MSSGLPAWTKGLVLSCPRKGKGVHQWLFIQALKLYGSSLDPAQLAQLLREATANCGREVTDREIEDAIQNSQRIAGGAPAVRLAPRWPQRNEKQIATVAANGPDLAGLESSSSVHWSGGQPHTEKVVDALFPGNPLL